MSNLEKIKNEFKAVIATIDMQFGTGYSLKNPGLVQHLMDKVQQEEDRQMTKDIHAMNIAG